MPYIATLHRGEYDIDAVLDNRGASGLAASRKRLKSGAEQAETSERAEKHSA
jgi:hypothetical protein